MLTLDLLLPPNKLQAGPDRPTGDVDQLLRGHQASEHIPRDKILCLNNMQLQLVSIVFARIMNVHNWFSQKIASRLINFSRAQNHRSWRVGCARVQPCLRRIIATWLFVCLWNKSTHQLSLLHRSTVLPWKKYKNMIISLSMIDNHAIIAFSTDKVGNCPTNRPLNRVQHKLCSKL